MKKIHLLISTLGLCLLSSVALAKQPVNASTDFNAVNAHGNLDLTLVMTQGKPRYAWLTKSLVLANVKIYVRQHTLYIRDNEQDIHPPTAIKIYLKQLKRLHVSGHVKVRSQQLRAKDLVVSAEGHSNVRLNGNIPLVQAIVNGQSALDARGLTTQQLLIKTGQQAQANVSPSQGLYAYANGQSNIYFYRTPEQLSRFTTASGNVLQLNNSNNKNKKAKPTKPAA